MKKLILSITALCCSFHGVNAQNYEWAAAMGGTSDDTGYGIAVDAAGNVYTTGTFNGTVDFDPGTGTANLTSVGSYDIFISKLDAAGNFVWVKQMGGTSQDTPSGIVLDASGNVYTTGYFIGTVDFDPGAGTANLTSAGIYDVYVSKLDAAGNFLWAKQMGGTDSEVSYGIAVDASGSVYTTGYFVGTADFDPGAGTANLTSAAGTADVFVSKLDASGNFVWAKQMGGTSTEVGYSITVDASENVYTTGLFQGIADFDPGVGTVNLTSAGQDDIFVSKLDASGNLVWVKQMGGANADIARGISLDASGNVYTTGHFQGTADFDPGAGTSNLTSLGNFDIFISKLDASGNLVWAKQMGGLFQDYSSSIALDASGNVYTTGFFYETVDFDPGVGTANLTSAGNTDVFISKLNSSGNFVWAKQLGGTSYEHGACIAVDASENVYTSGYFYETGDFDPGAGTVNLTAVGNSDIFVSKLGVGSVGISASNNASFNIYPNPASSNLTIETEAAIESVQVFNVNGTLVQSETTSQFSVASLASGVYIIHVKTEEGIITKRFSKK